VDKIEMEEYSRELEREAEESDKGLFEVVEYSSELEREAEESDEGLFLGVSTNSGGGFGVGVDVGISVVVVSVLSFLRCSIGSVTEELDVSDVMRLNTEVREESRDDVELFRALARVGLSDRLGKGLLADGNKGVNF
jgi:hypothetical protein